MSNINDQAYGLIRSQVSNKIYQDILAQHNHRLRNIIGEKLHDQLTQRLFIRVRDQININGLIIKNQLHSRKDVV